jgi:hypothetical protein
MAKHGNTGEKWPLNFAYEAFFHAIQDSTTQKNADKVMPRTQDPSLRVVKSHTFIPWLNCSE